MTIVDSGSGPGCSLPNLISGDIQPLRERKEPSHNSGNKNISHEYLAYSRPDDGSKMDHLEPPRPRLQPTLDLGAQENVAVSQVQRRPVTG